MTRVNLTIVTAQLGCPGARVDIGHVAGSGDCRCDLPGIPQESRAVVGRGR